ncbi:MAG: maltose alpha-D-glucosyltransferase [Desulfobacteraceae bacterium]|nr:MAG: maltose alpha-D-glucosyltransferase [Desulfobacteraceae bacterium]
MATAKEQLLPLKAESYWYREAVIYQLHVKSFYDSNEDGIGDFRGLTDKLDYIQDLGVNALWLLPFYPSPLRDDGYDISDCKSINPSYGTLGDFKTFLREAHRRGIHVITELVINHTSDQHPWFLRARHASPESSRRNWYVWSDTPERYKEARVIFQDFETSNWTWDPTAKAYYWHRFYSHQPDLNYDNPQVQKAILNTLDFWLELGVDGLRIDAVPYLFERDGTNCENLPESHEFIRKLRAHIDANYPNRMLLAEANQWPEDAAAYFGSGDEFHMAFHFPIMPRLYMALHMEDAFPILDIMEQTPQIPEGCQWAIFLRNHDELTLEMVTDEERDYMYRVYAQDRRMRLNLGIRRRLFPLLGNHRRRAELMNALLFSLPGTPIIYYGDEIGMGDNIHLGDRDGVRTPMQWSSDRNAGFSRADPQALFLPANISPEYHFEVINVEVQQRNLHSMLWWMKRLIGLRKRYKAFSRGAVEFLRPENPHILAFVRRHEEETLLVVANLCRFVQHLELDLSTFFGLVPIELFGRTKFPPIGSGPYPLMLSPHAFYWFILAPTRASEEGREASLRASTLPEIETSGKWENLFRDPVKSKLEEILSDYLRSVRWFGGKARPIKRSLIREILPILTSSGAASVLLVEVSYIDGNPETYVLPLTWSEDPRAGEILRDYPRAAIAWVAIRDKDKVLLLHDALVDKDFCRSLLKLIGRRRGVRVGRGELLARTTKAFRTLKPSADEPLEPSIMGAEQSNTSVAFGNRLVLKVIRNLTPGVNPDLEIGRYLTEKRFAHTPPIAGSLEFRMNRDEPMTLAMLHGYVPNQGDAWKYTLDQLGTYYEHALTQPERIPEMPTPSGLWPEQGEEAVPHEIFEFVGPYMESARLIGKRTAELHICLAENAEQPEFAPQPFSKLYQRSLYQSMRTLAGKSFLLLRRQASKIPDRFQGQVQEVLGMEKAVLERFRSILSLKISAMRIRCHGDYHLGQVLYTGGDFVIIDFEGEPARPISERKIKRCPIRDVAGMLRSFHYAAYAALFIQRERGLAGAGNLDCLEGCADLWYRWVCLAFLQAYIETARKGRFLPESADQSRLLLQTFMMEKAIYEMSYELNNRPAWIQIPLKGILDLMRRED